MRFVPLLLLLCFGCLQGNTALPVHTIGGSLMFSPLFSYSEQIDMEEIRASAGSVPVTGIAKSDEYGWSGGYMLRYRFSPRPKPVFLDLNLQYLSGRYQTYDGSVRQLVFDTISGDESLDTIKYLPLKGRKSNYFYKATLLAGYRFSGKRLYIEPVFGYEYRYWIRHLTTILREDYRWHYVPIGMSCGVAFNSVFTLSVEPKLKVMVQGNMDLILDASKDSTIERYESNPVRLGKKNGFETALALSFNVNKFLQFQCKPVFEYYEFGKSNIDTLYTYYPRPSAGESAPEPGRVPYYEPASKTFWFTLQFFLHLSFGHDD